MIEGCTILFQFDFRIGKGFSIFLLKKMFKPSAYRFTKEG